MITGDAYDVMTILISIQSLLGEPNISGDAYDVRTILISIQSLLGEPNISSPLNTQAAALWCNQEEYRKMVEKLYKPSVQTTLVTSSLGFHQAGQIIPIMWYLLTVGMSPPSDLSNTNM
ncbi:hypothetical protein KY290_024595 [Solanum tuberosum]|uniref:UBC core domain-containing protein n=1 Tax=Solanum tuberosum TaxID=4113 RepID=A0ABQ7UR41_SOLTU|nr:hypothetical protein KY284_023444 [Solanum tuberosum]KAH0754325.1 hypothetical protein KY290_024595 [Solanum tuberosum]